MELDSLPVYTYEVIYMFRNRCKLIFTLSVCQGKLNDNDEKSIIIRQQHDKTVNMCLNAQSWVFLCTYVCTTATPEGKTVI